jgi:glutamyl-tRNA reductase
MIDGLMVANLKKGTQILPYSGDAFALSTCQRTMILGLGLNPIKYIEKDEAILKIYHGKEAYQFLLETILGLQSEVLAEYEVVNQFKNAYQNYLQKIDKNSHIMSVLEKLFKDHKKIRTEHLMELGQMSYAGIARKIIHNQKSSENVLIVGSGSLSEDLINLLKKKYNVFVTARNPLKVLKLQNAHEIKTVNWMDLKSYANFSLIVNTIGTDSILFDEQFFREWQIKQSIQSSKLFIDLGSPSAIKTPLSKAEGVLRLEDIFNESIKLGNEKLEKIENAKKAIIEIAEERHQSFSVSFPFGWEELQFA